MCCTKLVPADTALFLVNASYLCPCRARADLKLHVKDQECANLLLLHASRDWMDYSNCLSVFSVAQHEPLCLAPHWACGLDKEIPCCNATRSVVWQVMPYSCALTVNGRRSRLLLVESST